MLKGVTQRQIIVLYVLLAVLVAVVGIRYLIFPMMERNDEKETQLLIKMSEYDNLVLECQQMQTFKNQNVQLMSEITEISKSFQSDIKASNIDSVISAIIRKSGLEVVSLNVGEAENVTEASLSQTQAEPQTQKKSDSTKADTEKDEAVKSVTTQLTTSGSYNELVKLIGLIAEQKAMYMKDLTFTMQVDKEKAEDMQMNFSIVSFVYTPAQENEQEVTELAS